MRLRWMGDWYCILRSSVELDGSEKGMIDVVGLLRVVVGSMRTETDEEMVDVG